MRSTRTIKQSRSGPFTCKSLGYSQTKNLHLCQSGLTLLSSRLNDPFCRHAFVRNLLRSFCRTALLLLSVPCTLSILGYNVSLFFKFGVRRLKSRFLLSACPFCCCIFAIVLFRRYRWSRRQLPNLDICGTMAASEMWMLRRKFRIGTSFLKLTQPRSSDVGTTWRASRRDDVTRMARPPNDAKIGLIRPRSSCARTSFLRNHATSIPYRDDVTTTWCGLEPEHNDVTRMTQRGSSSLEPKYDAASK